MEKQNKIQIAITRVNDRLIEAECNGERRTFSSRNFLDIDSLRVGDIRELYYNHKRDEYCELSLLFNREEYYSYKKKKFKIDTEIEGIVLIDKLPGFYVIKDKKTGAIGKIYKHDLPEGMEYIKGNTIKVGIDRNYNFSHYHLLMIYFLDNVKESNNYVFNIVKIEEIENSQKGFYAYHFYTENGMRILSRLVYQDIFIHKKNFELYRELIKNHQQIKLSIYFNVIDKNFYFNPESNIEIKDNENSELLFSKEYRIYYLKTQYAYIKLYTQNLSYIESMILKCMIGRNVFYEIKKRKCIIKEFDYKFIQNFENNEFKDLKLVDYVPTNINKYLYVVDMGSGLFGFIESSDYSYGIDMPAINSLIEKLRFKIMFGRKFIFLERKSYLVNPMVAYFSKKNPGDEVIAKVLEIHEQYLYLLIDNFTFSVIKSDLAPFQYFDIKEFYEKGKIYSFYLNQKNPDIRLLGYRQNEINEKLKFLINQVNTNINALIYTKLADCYILRIDQLIEAVLPFDELSHLDDPKDLLENKQKILVKIIAVHLNSILENLKYEVILSRKKLSSPVFEFQKYYPVGSKITGVIFHHDHEGLYLNIKHKNLEVSELIAFLPNQEIDDYPDAQKFYENSINKDIEAVITDYPSSKLALNLPLKDKSIILSIRQLTQPDIYDLYNEFDPLNLVLVESMLNKKIVIYPFDNERLYFNTVFKNRKLVFSVKHSRIIPFLNNERLSIQQYFQNLIEAIHANRLTEDELKVTQFFFKSELYEQKLFKFSLSGFRKIYYNFNNRSIELSLCESFIDFLKGKFKKSSIKVLRDDQNRRYGLFLNSLCLNIPVYFNQESVDEGKTYEICLTGFDETSETIQAEIVSLSHHNVGQEFQISISRQIAPNKYHIYFSDNLSGVLTSNKNIQLYEKEQIRAKLIQIEPELNFSYEGVICFSPENAKSYALTDLLELIQDKIAILGYNQEELKQIFLAIKDKTNNLSVRNELPLERLLYLLEKGHLFKQYLIDQDELGSGNFGVVYKGLDIISFKEIVQKKYIASYEDEESKKRFILEAEILQKKDIEGIVKVFDFNKDDMEYIADFAGNYNLRKFIDEHQHLSYSEKKSTYLSFFINLCQVLESVEYDKIVHCDLKPENVIYNADSKEICLIDFGSVQYESMPGGFGTIYYASPEQCDVFSNPWKHFTQEHDFKTETDVYSLGIMMYEVFVGKVPYGNELDEETIIIAHQFGQDHEDCEYSFKKPSEIQSDIEENLEAVILKSLSVNQEERYNSFWELKNDLEDLLNVFLDSEKIL